MIHAKLREGVAESILTMAGGWGEERRDGDTFQYTDHHRGIFATGTFKHPPGSAEPIIRVQCDNVTADFQQTSLSGRRKSWTMVETLN